MLMIITGIALIIAGLMNIFVACRIGFAAHNFNKAVQAVEAGLSDEADVEVLVASEDTVSSETSSIPEKISDVEEIKLDFSEPKLDDNISNEIGGLDE